MSWGTELWDVFDQVSNHTNKGIEFCEKYMHFIKERCQIENDYATKLKKLVKNYQPGPKKKGEDGSEFTTTKSFLKMIGEVHDMAGQHEVISEALQNNIVKELQALSQELKSERKKCLHDGQKQNSSLKLQMDQLDKTKKKYEKAFSESEKSLESYKRADADINLSRADVEKANTLRIGKANQCEECKSDYASELQKTNTAQKDHYSTLMPQIFQRLQDMDERRIQRVQGFIKQGADIEKSVIPIVNTCIEGMFTAANAINHTEDSNIVIAKYKSGFVPPDDIPFEDLSIGSAAEIGNNSNTPKNHSTVSRTGGTVKEKKKGRRGIGGLFNSKPKTDETKEDYSHLPPTQQKNKLKAKVESFRKHIATETASRDGMLKMRDVYQHNPQLGDASTLDKQIEENAQKLDNLKKEQQKFETYLAQVTDGNVPSRDSSMSNLSTHATVETSSKASTPDTTRHSLSGSSGSAEPQDAHPEMGDRRESFDDLDEDFTAPIGTCKAVYQFEATNEGSVPMAIGEELAIMEQDQGDGWTQVRKANGDMGFVPTSYIECHFD